jgi:hypothetical protein
VDNSRTLLNCYLVLKVESECFPLYIHNVYVPTDPGDNKQFFELPVDLGLDPPPPSASSERRKLPVLSEWLARLRVTEAWRVHHPESRVFCVQNLV